MDEQTKLSEEELQMFEQAEKGELPTLDVSQYIGRETVIVSATPGFKTYPEGKSYYVKFETDVIDTLKNGQEIRASLMAGLAMVDDKLIWGDNTKMGALLTKFKRKHWRDMVGVKVKIQTRLGRNGKEYLTF